MSAGAPKAPISVVIPSYNAAALLPDALDSVLAQDHAGLEIIVVDDGSSDDTARVVARYGAAVRYMAQPNRGIGAARNAGAAVARGVLITFFDADDIMTAASLRRRAETLARRPEVELVFGLTDHFISAAPDAAPDPAWWCPPDGQAVRFSGACLMRRSAFERVGGFRTDVTCGEMVDWCARAEEAGLVMAQIGDVVMRRRIHGANTTLLASDRQRDYLRVLKAKLDRRRASAAAAAT